MLPSIQVMDDIVLKSDGYDMDTCKDGRCMGILYGEKDFGSGRRERVLEFCMPLYPKEQEARLLHFRTKQLDSPQKKRLKQSMTMVVTLIQYTVLWGKSCFYGYLDQFLLTMNGRQ